MVNIHSLLLEKIIKKGKVIFVDTGALFAAANTKDKDYQKAKDFLTKLAEEKVILIATNFIIAEIYSFNRLPEWV